MNVFHFLKTTGLACGFGAWGIGLLLTQDRPSPRRTVAAVIAIVSAILLSCFPVAGGEPLLAGLPSLWQTATLIVPAGCGLAAVIAVLTARDERIALKWFAAAVLSNSALLLAGGSIIAGVTNLLVNLGCLGPLLLLMTLRESPVESTPRESGAEFRWLACAVLGLLLAGLLAGLPLLQSITSEAISRTQASVGFSWRDVGRALLYEHGVSLAGTSLLLFIAVVAATRMISGEPQQPAASSTGGPTA